MPISSLFLYKEPRFRPQTQPLHATASMVPTPTEDLLVISQPPLRTNGDHSIPRYLVPRNTEDPSVTTAADGFTLVRRRKGPAQ